MPIEIKELHIRVEVNATQSGEQTSGNVQRPAPQNQEAANEKKSEMMAECIEQVLKILDNKTER